MAAGTLYTYPENVRAYKALIAAEYSGSKITLVSEPPAFKLGETNKTDSFIQKFPLGKVPVFEATNGDCIFESNAIAYYVANDALRGSTWRDASFVQQWVNFADNEIMPAACTWVFPCMGIMQYNKQNTDRAKDDLKCAMNLLNNHLRTRTFLVGERVSLADISVACNLLLLYQWVLEPNFRSAFQNVNRWFTTCVNQPEFKKVIGDVTLCTKMAQFDAKKFAEMGGKGDKGGKKDKKEKPAKQEKQPKQEKKEPAEEEEPQLPKERKDPFALMPKGNFNLDEFKRTYSNKDTETVAIPYFWEHFEPEFMSIWHCEYKYTEELKKVFMACNLVGGMLQRLDGLRKHGFGSMVIFGEDNNISISGLWFWRGPDLAFELSSDMQVDYESYTWKKLDPKSEECKTLVKEYFCQEGKFGGKIVNQGKVFK